MYFNDESVFDKYLAQPNQDIAHQVLHGNVKENKNLLKKFALSLRKLHIAAMTFGPEPFNLLYGDAYRWLYVQPNDHNHITPGAENETDVRILQIHDGNIVVKCIQGRLVRFDAPVKPSLAKL